MNPRISEITDRIRRLEAELKHEFARHRLELAFTVHDRKVRFEEHSLLNTGHCEVVDADLSAYFDSIPHAELLKSVARRVCDRHVLHLIKTWLIAAVEEDDEKGGKERTTALRRPQSPRPTSHPWEPHLRRQKRLHPQCV
jgi:hypothetical protein